MSETTIVLAGDHFIVRQSLRALLEAEPDFRVIGEAGDGLETMPLVERLRPQVLVLDLLMPGRSGLEVARQVRQRAPETRVIVLSMHANEAYVLEALRHGAAAYVLKETSSAELVQAVRAVVAGRRYLSRPLTERALEAYAQRAEATPDLYETLTTREREVLHLAAEGRSNSEIAARLSISPRTVEIHRRRVMEKMRAESLSRLVRMALQAGVQPYR